MPCFHPKIAYMPADGGPVTFHETKNSRTVKLPCKQCIGCRTRRQNDLAVRVVCESKMHKEVWFPTLTYAPENLPVHGSLVHRDVQLFVKRTRKALGPFRYVVAGEYGDAGQRPHYHMVSFGLNIPDLQVCSGTYSKHRMWKSEALEDLWGKGQVRIGAVNFSVARYVATYCVKRVTGALADDHYSRVDDSTGEVYSVAPEYAVWSKGLGLSFLKKYWPEIFASGHDGVHLDGQMRPVPRFFRDRLAELDIPLDVVDALEFRDFERLVKGEKDSSPDRLAVRELCAKNRKAFFDGARR